MNKTQFRIIEETKDFGEKRFWYIESRTKKWIGWSPWRYIHDTQSSSKNQVDYKLRYLIENKSTISRTHGEIHTITKQKTKSTRVRDMILFLLCCVIMYTFIYVCATL